MEEYNWEGPVDFYTAFRAWVEHDKTIMSLYKSDGVILDRNFMLGSMAKSYNISKISVIRHEWYIEKD